MKAGHCRKRHVRHAEEDKGRFLAGRNPAGEELRTLAAVEGEKCSSAGGSAKRSWVVEGVPGCNRAEEVHCIHDLGHRENGREEGHIGSVELELASCLSVHSDSTDSTNLLRIALLLLSVTLLLLSIALLGLSVALLATVAGLSIATLRLLVMAPAPAIVVLARHPGGQTAMQTCTKWGEADIRSMSSRGVEITSLRCR